MTEQTLLGFYWVPSGQSIDNQIDLLTYTGANTVYVPHRALDQLSLSELRRRGIQVYVDWTIFAGEELREAVPDSAPIDAAGAPFVRDEWYVPACPNHPEVRRRRLDAIQDALDRHGQEIAGVWLDFIRFPVRWEAAQPRLRQLCFCPNCLNLFLGEDRPSYSPEETQSLAQTILAERRDEWIAWKCERIADFVRAVRAEVAQRNLATRLGMFSLPWRRADMDGAIRAIVGQDLGRLAESIDAFSPMVYHKLCYRPLPWIAEVVRDVQEWTSRPVLPIIQSLDQPEPMAAAEMDGALLSALEPAPEGVMIFTLAPLLDNAEKAAAVRARFQAAKSRF
jgi:hypothetical protein